MFIFFWPAILLAIICCFIAIRTMKPLFFMISFVLVIPFSLYLAGTPLFSWWALLIPFLFLFAAYTLKKEKIFLSFFIVSPAILLFGLTGTFVLSLSYFVTQL